jgi:Gpi18-like mannosyltransferase
MIEKLLIADCTVKFFSKYLMYTKIKEHFSNLQTEFLTICIQHNVEPPKICVYNL